MSTSSTPPKPLVVIGDVHGQLALLNDLLRQIHAAPHGTARALVFTGDLLDRGPDSRGVVDRIIELRAAGQDVEVVCGNHDFAFAAATGIFETPPENHWPQRYLKSYNAASTFRSYGTPPGDLESLRQAIPAAHRELFAQMPWAVRYPDLLVVHAGLLPDIDYASQLQNLEKRDRRHNRPPWLCDKMLSRTKLPAGCNITVVSGHVVVSRVQLTPHRVLVDTGAGSGGPLSCLLWPEKRVLQAEPA